MIISILTILLVITLHLFPKRVREKVLYRLKRVFARIRQALRGRLAAQSYEFEVCSAPTGQRDGKADNR